MPQGVCVKGCIAMQPDYFDVLNLLIIAGAHLLAAGSLVSLMDNGKTATSEIGAWMMGLGVLVMIAAAVGRSVVFIARLLGVPA